MAKDTNFIFGRHDPLERPDRIPEKYFQTGAWPSSRDPVNCMALSANSYKMVEAIPYGFQICVSSDKARIGN